MILLAEKTMILKHAVEQVFPYVTNMENYGEWFPGVLTIESVDPQEHGNIGKRYKETLAMPTGNATLLIEVKDCVPGKRFYTEGDLDPVFPAMKMLFEESERNEESTEKSTTFYLSYYSRNSDLSEDDGMIKALRENLSTRIEVAAVNLKVSLRESLKANLQEN